MGDSLAKARSSPSNDQKLHEHQQKYGRNIVKGKKTVPYDLQIGDRVLVYKERLSNKIKEIWHPGYCIKEKILPDAYLVVKDNRSYCLNKAHVKKDWAGIKEGNVVTRC